MTGSDKPAAKADGASVPSEDTTTGDEEAVPAADCPPAADDTETSDDWVPL